MSELTAGLIILLAITVIYILVQDDRKQRKDLDDWYKDRFGK